MLPVRRAAVPALPFDAELPGQRHAALTLARGIGIAVLAVIALGVFLAGALALGAVVMIS